MAVEEDVVQKSGAWFSFGEVRLGQGRENSKTFIRENRDLFDEIKKLVLEKKGVVPVGELPPGADEEPLDAPEDI